MLLAIPGSLGLGQAQYPALRLLGTDQFGCPHRLGSQIPPAPQWGTASLRGSMLMPPPIQAGVTCCGCNCA